jgi:hypothetical protein
VTSVSAGHCVQRCGAPQLHSSLVKDTSVCASPSSFLYYFSPFMCAAAVPTLCGGLVADPCAVCGVLSEVGFAGWGWCDLSPVEGAVCPFDLCLHDGRHRCNLGLPERSWKHRTVDSSPIWCDLRALSMDLN